MRFSKNVILVSTVLLNFQLHAQNFEIIDGNSNVSGKPNISQTKARENWDAACAQWKTETKELNKSDQVMALSCETPTCDSNEGIVTCSSVAIYKVKTSGTRVETPPPPQPVVSGETVVPTAPPPVIVEAVPAPQPGFIWIGGYWGWHEHRHSWFPGHWEHSRPGFVWIGSRWAPHSRGYRFESGHWRR